MYAYGQKVDERSITISLCNVMLLNDWIAFMTSHPPTCSRQGNEFELGLITYAKCLTKHSCLPHFAYKYNHCTIILLQQHPWISQRNDGSQKTSFWPPGQHNCKSKLELIIRMGILWRKNFGSIHYANTRLGIKCFSHEQKRSRHVSHNECRLTAWLHWDEYAKPQFSLFNTFNCSLWTLSYRIFIIA